MKNLVKSLLLFCIVAFVVPVQAKERVDSKIRFNDLYGEVSIRPNDEEDDAYEFAEFDTVIYENDRIRTKEDSGAILGLSDMNTFVIKPESIVVIHSEEDNTSKFEMVTGRIWGNIKKISEGKTIGFEMTQCVAGIKGTIFRLTSSASGMFNRIDVVSGVVEVAVKADGRKYVVPSGECLTVRSGGKVSANTIAVETMKEQFKQDLIKMDSKLDDSGLLKKLQDENSDINSTKNRFNESYLEIKKVVEISKNFDQLKEANLRFESLILEANRYKGTLEEARASVRVANSKSKVGQEMKRVVLTLNSSIKACAFVITNIENLADQIRAKMNRNLSIKRSPNEEVKQEMAVINERVDRVSDNTKNMVESVKDGSSYSGNSYSEFKGILLQLNGHAEILESERKKLLGLLNSNPVSDKNEAAILKKKVETAYSYVKSVIKELSDIPEISNDVLKVMNDLESSVTTCATDVRTYLNEYKSINRASNTSKKRYVIATTKLIAGYDRVKRQYTKANRIYSEIVGKFTKSKYRTAEYIELAESWRNIEEAMNNLHDETAELSSCTNEVNEQLNAVIGW